MSITSISKTSPICDTRPLTRASPSTLLARRPSKSKSERHRREECRARPSLLGITGKSGHLHHLREEFDRRSDHPCPARPRFDLLPPSFARPCQILFPRDGTSFPISGSFWILLLPYWWRFGAWGHRVGTGHTITHPPAVLLIHTRLVALGMKSDHERMIADVTISSLQLVTSHFTSLHLIVLAIVDALNPILPVNL